MIPFLSERNLADELFRIPKQALQIRRPREVTSTEYLASRDPLKLLQQLELLERQLQASVAPRAKASASEHPWILPGLEWQKIPIRSHATTMAPNPLQEQTDGDQRMTGRSGSIHSTSLFAGTRPNRKHQGPICHPIRLHYMRSGSMQMMSRCQPMHIWHKKVVQSTSIHHRLRRPARLANCSALEESKLKIRRNRLEQADIIVSCHIYTAISNQHLASDRHNHREILTNGVREVQHV